MGAKSVIAFWYKKLNFPSKYDGEFYRALEEIEIPADSKLEDYDPKCEDGKRNLLAYLYFCEELKRRYEEKGIGEDILMDTLSDLVVWTDVWSELKGELWLGELYSEENDSAHAIEAFEMTQHLTGVDSLWHSWAGAAKEQEQLFDTVYRAKPEKTYRTRAGVEEIRFEDGMPRRYTGNWFGKGLLCSVDLDADFVKSINLTPFSTVQEAVDAAFAK